MLYRLRKRPSKTLFEGLGWKWLRLALFCTGSMLAVRTDFALQTDQSLSQLIHEQWHTEDGLPQNAVHCLVQDQTGFIWFGTENGLVRFDGVRFEVFREQGDPALPHNFISSLLVARDGTLWAGTRTGGLCRYRDRKFEIPAPEFLDADIMALAETSDGAIWAATADGVLRWDGNGVVKFGTEAGLPTPETSALHAMPDGSLLVGTRDGHVLKLRDGKFEVVVEQSPGLGGSPVKALAFDARENKLWIARDGAGLYSLQSNRLSRVDLMPEEGAEYLTALLLDADGTLWVATQNGGLIRLKNETKSALSRESELRDDDVLSVYKDREGSIWVGTHFAGLSRLCEGKAITLTEGLPVPTVTAVAEEDAETLWVGTRGGGLFKFSHCAFTEVPLGIAENPDRGDVRALLKSSAGELWVGTYGGGLGRISANGEYTFFTTADGLCENQVSSLLEVAGEIWIGTVKGGMCVYNPKDNTIRDLGAPEFLKTHIRSMALAPDGKLWIGTQNGLVTYENGEFRQVELSKTPDISVRIVVPESDGTLWIGTRDHGLIRLVNGREDRFSPLNGLIHNRIYHILLVGEYMYLAGNQGIERVSRTNLNEVAEGREKKLSTRLYTNRDGLRTSECGGDSSPSAVLASSGSMWFGTREGLTQLPPRDPAKISEPPNVRVTSVTVDNNRKMAAADFTKLMPGETRLQIDYTALSLRNPAGVFFKHKLEGTRMDWVDAGRDRQAVFYNLDPGTYTFRVKACNDEGVWNENGATLAFTIVPYVHETGWFRALMGLGGVGLIAAGFRWRVRQIQARNRLLKTVVAERTKELQGEVNQRTEAETQLRVLNEELESRVRAGTTEVRRAYEDLQIQLHERQQAEQALAQSEARLRRIVDSGMVGILFWEREGKISDANDTFLRMVGYTREELREGQISWEALTPEEHLKLDAAALEEIKRTGVCTPFEKEYVRKDGTRFPIMIGGASLVDGGERGVCFVLDISKLKETEEEIRQLNLQLEARVHERTTELARTNEQLESEVQERKRVGVALSAFSHLGQRLHSARTEKEAAEIVAQTAKSLIPHDICSIELYDSNGKLSPVLESVESNASKEGLCCSISVSIRNGSRVVGVIGLKNSRGDSFNYADANTLQALGDYCGGALERIHAEQARRETERRFSTFMTNAPALAWMKDARFRYVYTNAMFQRFIGMTAEEIVGKTDYDLWPDHVAFHMRTNDTEAVRTQSKLESQEQLKRYDGEARTLLTLRFLFTTATGEQFVAGMAVDISEQKRAEEALHKLPQSILEAQETERRRVARELHDGVNQAIASVKFRIQAAEQQIIRGDPKWQETCSKTKDMLDSVLQQVRRLSRNLRPGELDDFGLVAAARSACQEFELRSGIQVRFSHSDFLERFPAALELSLYRIIQEALTNVERHSGASEVEIELSGDDSYVTLEISDNGCGFDMGEVTGRRPDAGLGLLHMRERASLAGGVFSMTTSPGNGLRLSIHVPVARREEVLSNA